MTNPKQDKSQKCLKRWWRQLCFVPILHNKWLTDSVKTSLSNKVTEAEQGHRGEVVLIVENHLPVQTAYYQG
ncbi:MAG: hypothetical protein CR962_01130, partial [Gammaproteobacteria bacterium]